jgi:hypothetical protein
MAFETFWATVGAVIFANGMSLLYVWAFWSGSKSEAKGQRISSKAILCGLLGPVICGVSIFATVNW